MYFWAAKKIFCFLFLQQLDSELPEVHPFRKKLLNIKISGVILKREIYIFINLKVFNEVNIN